MSWPRAVRNSIRRSTEKLPDCCLNAQYRASLRLSESSTLDEPIDLQREAGLEPLTLRPGLVPQLLLEGHHPLAQTGRGQPSLGIVQAGRQDPARMATVTTSGPIAVPTP